jgi:cytochrome c peroxidase
MTTAILDVETHKCLNDQVHGISDALIRTKTELEQTRKQRDEARARVTSETGTTGIGQLTDFAVRLSFNAFYDAMAAMRGPDVTSCSYCMRLKNEVTNRIRQTFWKTKPGSAGTNPTVVTDVVFANIHKAVQRARSTYGAKHFFGHLIDGVNATRSHAIWGGKANAITNALHDASNYCSY